METLARLVYRCLACLDHAKRVSYVSWPAILYLDKDSHRSTGLISCLLTLFRTQLLQLRFKLFRSCKVMQKTLAWR